MSTNMFVMLPAASKSRMKLPCVPFNLRNCSSRKPIHTCIPPASGRERRLGIDKREGKRIRTELPDDMREGADRDFGG